MSIWQGTIIATGIATGLLIGACVHPPSHLGMDPDPAENAYQALDPQDEAALAPGVMCVRLSAYEGKIDVRVIGSAEGEVAFHRAGDSISSSNGERAKSFLMREVPNGGGFILGERVYLGDLRISLGNDGGLSIENQVGLEDYIAGVVPAELILWSAKESEIEAQAIAARTYALRSLGRRKVLDANAFLWDDTRDQVYLGQFQPEDSDGSRRVAARLQRALQNSNSLVMRDSEGDLYDVRFHASCGGYTTSPAEAFPLESTWHHSPVRCEPCAKIGVEESSWPVLDKRRRRVHWRWTVPAADLNLLAQEMGSLGAVTSLSTPQIDGNERWQSVVLQGTAKSKRVSIEDFRRVLGAASLKSGRMVAVWPRVGERITGGVFFEGLGRGHGAGLCQIGSHEYAQRGWTAERILNHYLPGVRIEPLPTARIATSSN
ncbi:MAG: stage II sporulation protein D [Planctomycetota bacterium]